MKATCYFYYLTKAIHWWQCRLNNVGVENKQKIWASSNKEQQPAQWQLRQQSL